MISTRSFLSIVAVLSLVATCFIESGCQTKPVLEPGGEYSSVDLFKIDQSIKSANETMKAFVEWENQTHKDGSRAAELAFNVGARRLTWIKDAYVARDAFAAARTAATKSDLDAALKIITEILNQIAAAKQSHA